jgi:peroxiredoxin
MKRFLLPLAAVGALFLTSCQSQMEVSVELTNWNPTDTGKVWARFVQVTDDNVKALDSALVEDGRVTLQAELDAPQIFFVQIDGIQPPVMLFGWKESVEINGDAAILPFAPEFSGSDFADSLYAFTKNQTDFQAQARQMEGEYGRAMQTGDMTTAEALTQRFNGMYEKNEKDMVRFAENNGALGAFVANRYLYQADLESLKKVLAGVDGDHNKATEVVKLSERVAKLEAVSIGNKIPELTQATPDGTPLTLSSVTGKVILVDFWASWCRPCRAQNPDLVALYNEFHAKGFELVGVSFDENKEAWVEAIAQDGLTWPQMSDLKGWNNAAAELFSIRAIPQNVVTDSKGKIVLRNASIEDLRAYLVKNLK